MFPSKVENDPEIEDEIAQKEFFVSDGKINRKRRRSRRDKQLPKVRFRHFHPPVEYREVKQTLLSDARRCTAS